MKKQRILRKSGFTLVEILIVVTVVAVLAAILFATFNRVREKGRSTVCQSNLKQIALAIQQYVQDNSGRYPHNMYETNKNTPAAKFVHWNHAVMTYVKNNAVFRCPTSKATEELRAPSIADINGRIITRRDTSYAYNYSQVNDVPTQLDNSPTSTKMQGSIESKIVFDSKTILNYDRPWQEEQYDDGSITLIDPESISSSCGASIAPATMHSGGANYSFADSHVKWMTPSQMGEMKCAEKIQ